MGIMRSLLGGGCVEEWKLRDMGERRRGVSE
jgi:hypothetical protein